MLAHVCLFHFLSRRSDACSSMRTKSGFVCVNMSTNLRVCECERPVVQCERSR